MCLIASWCVSAHEGECVANNTSWRPESCLDCRCHGDVSICRPTHCPNPNCDVQRVREVLIPANQCCPECVSSSQSSCQYEGVTYGWSPSSCSLCVCSRGRVSCSARPCPEVGCPADQSPFTPAGECCPKCGRNGGKRSCSWQGATYRDGEEWKPSSCSRCVCSDGDVQCSVAECRQVACKPHENLVIPAGQCCPQCVSNPCLSAGKQYQHGQQWQKDACTTCVCDRGQSKCHTNTCRPVACDKVGFLARSNIHAFSFIHTFYPELTSAPCGSSIMDAGTSGSAFPSVKPSSDPQPET
uniref:VWFC domain-containing protein n=1 Tax=Stegastes partitus TaxID=144197 RepID=A0A3B5BBU9_9TELE